MDIAKWIADHHIKITDLDADESDLVILVDDLEILLKTNTLVPNEPTAKMIEGFWGEVTHGEPEIYVAKEAYKAMLEAAKEGK